MSTTPPATDASPETVGPLLGVGAVPPPTTAIRAGSHLGRYVVLRAIGTGGAGTVYQAFDPELGRRAVAIKVLHASPTDSEGTLDAHSRLLREAQAMARVRHTNVMPVYDVGTFDGASSGRAGA